MDEPLHIEHTCKLGRREPLFGPASIQCTCLSRWPASITPGFLDGLLLSTRLSRRPASMYLPLISLKPKLRALRVSE